MHTDFDNLRDAARDALRALEREREQMEERAQRLEIFYKLTEHMKEMLAENEKLEEENRRLHSWLAKRKQTFPEIHNHFGAGSTAQIFNDKVYSEN